MKGKTRWLVMLSVLVLAGGSYVLLGEGRTQAVDGRAAANAGPGAHGEDDGHGHEEEAEHDDEQGHDEEADHEEGGEEGHAEGEHDEEQGHGPAAVSLTPEQIARAGIVLQPAAAASVGRTLRLPGEIGFDQDRTAHVQPRSSGVVEQVLVSLGDQVSRGQVLAVLSSQQISEQRSELAAGQRRLALARTVFEREQKLWQEGISAQQDFLAARQALQEADIAVTNARQKLNALIGSNESETGSRYTLTAPFDSVIVEKHLVVGETVTDADVAFVLSDLSRVWANFSVSPGDLSQVLVGQMATVRSPDLNTSVQGRVAYVGSLLGEQTRTATARVTLENPDGAWRPGLFVNVEVLHAGREAAVTVPEGAIQSLEGQDSVFVRRADGFVAQPVRQGAKGRGRVEIVEGLDAGAEVVVDGSFILKSELGKGSAEHSH
ncbi:efflux RND transporter periplasmic adaptor subunit [Halopseudomonas maritima]|uniref:efflux RND transporter periplasmic adaptor subunit n=1 Tax=Halopseudomonas maritima TaxID=2918528 RepID=UPI001EEBB300|nr:efflux RND transporter periplasmic adaptor subunit [Halopseudomonas maritima]UJJ32954.1 efflux RND transporter periplasmic adaptor subunit [Halopseudomonas maritima]